MERTVETEEYGKVIVRHAMFDGDGTSLEEGVEFKIEDGTLLEINEWLDIEELSSSDVEAIITKLRDYTI